MVILLLWFAFDAGKSIEEKKALKEALDEIEEVLNNVEEGLEEFDEINPTRSSDDARDWLRNRNNQ